jgi:hypothetical protein
MGICKKLSLLRINLKFDRFRTEWSLPWAIAEGLHSWRSELAQGPGDRWGSLPLQKLTIAHDGRSLLPISPGSAAIAQNLAGISRGSRQKPWPNPAQ